MVVAINREEGVPEFGHEITKVLRPMCEIPMCRHGVKPETAKDREEAAALALHDRIGAVKRVSVITRRDSAAGLHADAIEQAGNARITAQRLEPRPIAVPKKLWMRLQVTVDVVDLQ
jgi:hypothetical protein